MHRLFVAVWLPDDVLELIGRLERPPVEGLRWTRREQWHVTLRFLGPLPDVEEVRGALAALRELDAVHASLGPAVGRFGQRILHVPVRGLDRLARAAVDATATLGRPPEARPFTGHVTLARVAKGAGVDLRAVIGAPIAAEWDVTTISLVESHLSPTGAHYEVLERFGIDGGAT